MTAPHRVLIVDDHRVVVDGLRALLGDYSDIEVVGSAASLPEAVERAVASEPDVVLMDYRLKDGDGAAATAAIRERLPNVAVVFLSADDSEGALFAAIEAGAVGYLDKSEATNQVVDAVRRAAAGEMLVPQALLMRLIHQQRRRRLDERKRRYLLDTMTARELEILRLMAGGLDNQQIAERLVISYQTVRTHGRNVLSKLSCHTKLAAVARAGEFGLLDERGPAEAAPSFEG